MATLFKINQISCAMEKQDEIDKKKMFLLGGSTYPKKSFEPEMSTCHSMELNPIASPESQNRLNSEATMRDKQAKFNTLLQRSE